VGVSFSGSTNLKLIASRIEALGASANYGLSTNTGGRVNVDNSSVSASTATLQLVGTSGGVFIGASRLEGGAVQPGSMQVVCAGVYDEAYVFSASVCP
jgi:hypothetical protein